MNDKKALKSSLWYTVSNFLIGAIGFITTPIFTRIMTKGEFGDYSNYTSWLAILTIIVTLNLEATLISARYDYYDNFDEYVFSTLTLSSISAIFWLLIINIFHVFFVGFFKMNMAEINIMLIYLIFLPCINLFQARERYLFEYVKSVILSLAICFFTTTLAIILVKTMEDKVLGRILGAACPPILIGLAIYIYFFLKVKKIHISYYRYALKICIPYIPHLLSLTVLSSIDRIMIKKICGSDDNAMYTVAYYCALIITMLLSSLNSAYAPWVGEKLSQKKYDEIRKFSIKYMKIFLGLSLGIMLVAPEVMFVLGGKKYMEAVYAIPPVAAGCMIQFLYTMIVNVEQFKKKIIPMAFASVLAALINYILNSIFIPKYGYVAAAYTTFVGYMFLLIMHMIVLKWIKLSQVYSYMHILISVGITVIFMITCNIIYSFVFIRYAFIAIYVALFVYIIYKYRIIILNLIKNKK